MEKARQRSEERLSQESRWKGTVARATGGWQRKWPEAVRLWIYPKVKSIGFAERLDVGCGRKRSQG